MIRDALDADGPCVMLNVQPRGRVQMIARVSAGTSSAGTNTADNVVTDPVWLRLTRQGDLFTGAYSVDGANWVDVLDETFGPARFSVTLSNEVLIGLASSPQLVDQPAVTAQAKISQVSVEGNVTPGTFDQTADIGLSYNEPDNLYVVVEDQAGKTATVTHPDNPNTVVTAEWIQWIVNLEDLVGVDLSSVTALTVGIGNPDGAAGN